MIVLESEDQRHMLIAAVQSASWQGGLAHEVAALLDKLASASVAQPAEQKS